MWDQGNRRDPFSGSSQNYTTQLLLSLVMAMKTGNFAKQNPL